MKAPTQKRKPWQEERVVHQRKADNSKFYNSRTWRNFRKIELELNPLCVKCEAKGIVEPARVLDHIVRIEDGGAELTKENTQSLCKKCHDSKSGKEAHGYREKRGMGKNR